MKTVFLIALLITTNFTLATTFGVLANKADQNYVPDGNDNNDIVPSASDKNIIASNLEVPMQRISNPVMEWSGKSSIFEAVSGAGFRIQWNLNVGEYPADKAKYKSNLQAMVTKYTPELVVIENEETQQADMFYKSSKEQYVAQLKMAVHAIQEINKGQNKKIKISNGGITSQPLIYAIHYFLYYDLNQKMNAQEFANQTMPAGVIKDLPELAKHPLQKQMRDEALYLIREYAKIPGLTYINFHVYDPDLSALATTIDVLRQVTLKDVILNEYGMSNLSADSPVNFSQVLVDKNVPYAIYYSGDSNSGAHAKALHRGKFNDLRDNGKQFRDFVVRH